jgi:DNA-directed RNA polymerase subunit RPC12/RpoP
LYENGTPNRSLCFQAYFDRGDLLHGETSGNTIVKAESLPEDPYAMGCFFPDQIVECILVPDEHQRFLSTAVHVSVDISEVTATGKNPVRIFLKRQILTETYNPALPIYICVDCGRQFLSLAGMRYHCRQRLVSKATSRRARSARRDKRRLRLFDSKYTKVLTLGSLIAKIERRK